MTHETAEWRNATDDEMRKWRTLAGLKSHFSDARLTSDDGVNYRYQVRQTGSGVRALHTIADDISRKWPEPNYAARPYIYGMRHVATMDDFFGADSADTIVRYFLTNAGSWRGEDARRIKAELRGMLK